MRVTDYLNDRIQILQDTDYYRFTSDSLLLSRFARAKKDDVVADFCAGSGVVGLNFYAEKGAASVTLFEAQAELAAMSRETVALNGLEKVFRVEETRIQDVAPAYTEYFSLILCNPPYERGGFDNADEGKAKCRKELTLTFPELAAAVKRCLKFGGRFVFCHRADRFAEICCTLREAGIEVKRCQFIAGVRGKKPYLVLAEAVKGGKPGLEVLPEAYNQEGKK